MWTKAPTKYNYTLDDIVVVDITPEMLRQAEAEKKYYMENKQGALTNALVENRDIKGSLAHQAIEYLFDLTKFTYESTRLIKQKGGDKCDIIFGKKIIDVKHAFGKFNPEYFYNHNCAVTKDEWHRRLVDSDINYFVFVNVDLEENQCFVLGAIDKFDFDEEKEEFKIKCDGYQVKSRQLIPIRKFIYN